MKTLYVETHKIYKMYKFDVFNNLQCFHNALVTSRFGTRGADKSLAPPGRKQPIATEDFEFHISYL